MNKYLMSPLAAVALVALTACGGSTSSTTSTTSTSAASATDSASPMASQTPGDAASSTPSSTDSASAGATSGASATPSDSAAAPAGATSSTAASAAPVGDPQGTMLLLSTVPPKQVGAYTGKELTTTGLGKGSNTQWEYETADNSSTMSLVATTVSYTDMVKTLQGTGKPLGKIATCGLMYANKQTPVCMVRLENGANLSVGGDYQATVSQVRTFTSQFLALARTK